MDRRLKRDPYKLVGTTLGRYKVLELAGIGGMGVVYRAQHMVTRGVVALKLLKPDLAINNPDMIKLFLEEAAKTVNLSHPYIIKVTDADLLIDAAAADTAFLVMEWLDGHTLEDELKERGAMTLDRVAPLIEQICEAVAHAHANGIIHRDLKPSNIMLVKDHRGDEAVKIVDFGIAKALTTTVGANSRVMGAPYYASPEQLIVGAAIDHRSDIYSLGVLSYQMLTGKLPFDATSIDMMIRQTISVPPPSIQQMRSDIPGAVEEVVFRALAKRPQDRYQSVNELARAIRQATSVETGELLTECVDASTGSALVGASVYLNGRHVGETDGRGLLRREHLIPGEYLVEIESLQHQPWKQQVQVKPKVELRLTAGVLRKELGDLVVKASVSGADVLLNGEKVGTTDEAGMLYLKDLALGKVMVEVKYYKRYSSAREAVIIQGQQSHLEVELPPVPRRNYPKEVFEKASSFLARPVKALRRAGLALAGGLTRAAHSRALLILLLSAAAVAASSLLVIYAYERLKGPGPVVNADPTPAAPTPAPSPEATPAPAEPPRAARTLNAAPRGVLVRDCELCKVAVGADGRMIASTGSDDRVRLWRVGERAPFMLLTVPKPPASSVAISRDGGTIAAGDDGGAILLWRADGTPLKTLQTGDYVWDLRFSPDGQALVSTESSAPSTVRVWRAGDWSQAHTLKLPPSSAIIAVSGGGDSLALLGEKEQAVQLWSLSGNRLLRQVGGENYPVTSGAFSPDGGLLAIGSRDGVVRLWRVGDGGLAAELEGEKGEVGDIAFSADGRTLAAGMSGGAIRLWDVRDGSLLTTLDGHDKIVLSLSFSSDGGLLASGSDDRTIRLWQLSEN